MLSTFAEKLSPIQKYIWSKIKQQMDIQDMPSTSEEFSDCYDSVINNKNLLKKGALFSVKQAKRDLEAEIEKIHIM